MNLRTALPSALLLLVLGGVSFPAASHGVSAPPHFGSGSHLVGHHGPKHRFDDHRRWRDHRYWRRHHHWRDRRYWGGHRYWRGYGYPRSRGGLTLFLESGRSSIRYSIPLYDDWDGWRR